jgi:hypothetical protein
MTMSVTTESAQSDTWGCLGSTIKLFTGGYYDLANPRACDVHIEDIAHALAYICRFGGHIPRWYSVAEHSVECWLKVVGELHSREIQLACLLHDAAEAYLGDVVKPLKVLLDPIYGPLEKKNEQAIAERFGVDFGSTKIVWKRIDREMLLAERDAIFGKDGQVWSGEESVEKYVFQPQFNDPVAAEQRFLSAFYEIMEG